MTDPGQEIRVLLVDDDPLLRAGLALMLEPVDGVRVVADVGSGEEAVPAVLAHRPDVVLLDYRMGELDGISTTREIGRLEDPPRVVLLTTFDMDDLPVRAVQAGAVGFLLKTDLDPAGIGQAIRDAAAGHAPFSPQSAGHVVEHVRAGGADTRREEAVALVATLSDREREVCVHLARGETIPATARRMYLSESTVKSHLGNATTKLGVDSRMRMGILIDRAGLI
ncbi:response regulator [Janibacter corallicola]|uniref:response regulator n=1 Tax=Janibacter corallicola TaxID=415212 RepID=UPI0008344B13|nr:response regulator transcription factor [Janibacter corallicola]